MPITLGQEFSGYHAQIELCKERIENTLKNIYSLPIGKNIFKKGGTAVGTGMNTYEGFSEKVIKEIKEFTHLPFYLSNNRFESISTCDK